MYALIALAVTAGIGTLLYFKWYRPKVQREERELGEQVEEFPVLGRHPKARVGDSTEGHREQVDHRSS
jgi:hypothetical protein